MSLTIEQVRQWIDVCEKTVGVPEQITVLDTYARILEARIVSLLNPPPQKSFAADCVDCPPLKAENALYRGGLAKIAAKFGPENGSYECEEAGRCTEDCVHGIARTLLCSTCQGSGEIGVPACGGIEAPGDCCTETVPCPACRPRAEYEAGR